MPLVSTSFVNAFLDRVCAWAHRARGASGQDYGLGGPGEIFGAYAEVQQAAAVVAQSQDLEITAALSRGVLDVVELGGWLQFFVAVWSSPLHALSTLIASAGEPDVINIETYLTHFNAGPGGIAQATMPPIWKEIYAAATTIRPARHNLYFTVLVSTQTPNALGSRSTVGSFTPGVSVGSDYAGGVPMLRYASMSSSRVVTVTGTAFHFVTKATIANVTWTANVPSGSGVVPLQAGTAPSTAYIVSATDISFSPGMGGGTVYVEAHRPTGRLQMP